MIKEEQANRMLDQTPRPTLRQIRDDTGLTYYQVRKLARAKGEPEKLAKNIDPSAPLVRSDIIKKLRKGFVGLAQFAAKLGCTEQALREAIEHVAERGYNVIWDGPRVSIAKQARPGQEVYKDHCPLVGEERVIGVLGDTHLCSTFERLDVLEEAYNEFSRLGITDIYHTGNMVDGHCTFNRFELKRHGITDQALYCLDHYPQRKGITTHFITGLCHEGWWFKREGLDFGRYLMGEARDRGRDDLHYLGFQEADVELATKHGSGILRCFHPGGGSSYAHSYATQKIVESLQGGEKPGVLLCGHFHKAIYHMVRNVHVIQTGCCQDQTRWMRGKKLAAHVGYWIVRIQQDKRGAIRRVKPEFTNYYDRGYHIKMISPPPARAGLPREGKR